MVPEETFNPSQSRKLPDKNFILKGISNLHSLPQGKPPHRLAQKPISYILEAPDPAWRIPGGTDQTGSRTAFAAICEITARE